jgi:hypothetical protein
MPPAAERRQAPRARPPLDLRLRLVGNPDVVEIRDLSASGVRCATLQPLSVMTQVHLVLLLPAGQGPGTASSAASAPREVAADGVVVRCVRDAKRAGEPRYDTAIFFLKLDGADRETLAGYVLSLRNSGLVA